MEIEGLPDLKVEQAFELTDASAEQLAAVCVLLGRIPTVQEYFDIVGTKIQPFADNLYRYLNFDQITGFEDEGRVISKEEEKILELSVK